MIDRAGIDKTIANIDGNDGDGAGERGVARMGLPEWLWLNLRLFPGRRAGTARPTLDWDMRIRWRCQNGAARKVLG